jgi:ATP-dependent DNA helicase DinG
MQNLSDIFDSLAHAWPEYSVRKGQLELAINIDSVMKSGAVGIFEAGTGTGKTLSYLVPAFIASGSVIISTGTKNLQDQLFQKDLPVLQKMFPEKRVALLKGRTNYLCPQRLKINIKIDHRDELLAHQLMEVRSWSIRSRTNDLTEILDPEENVALQKRVTSTRDNCLGSRCPEFNDCPLYRAREQASQADIVIVNHHLLLADLAQRGENIRSLFPVVTALIIDEAHQIPGVARQFFGQRLSSGQFSELLRDVRAELFLLGNDDPHSLDHVKNLDRQLVVLKQLMLAGTNPYFEQWLDKKSHHLILAVDQALAELGNRLLDVAARSDGLAQCAKRALGMADIFALLTEKSEPGGDYVHWIERTQGSYTIHLSPLEISTEFQKVVRDSEASWVFTSATLSVDGSFNHFKSELGVFDEISAIFESPFDYLRSVKAYVPTGLPEAGSDEHTKELVAHCAPLIANNNEKTFFLFTSHRALQFAALELKQIGRPLLVQGTKSKIQMLAEFKESPRSVLLGTQSFWEGVDVRSAGLKLLIIDKLPFPNPSDPIYNAQSMKIRSNGGNGFTELALPKTVLALKQGFGRLMREASDMGLFVLGDSRIHSRSYRKYVTNNLPEMVWLDNQEDAVAWMRKL